MGALECRGLDKGHFRQFLQCWALLQMEPQFKAAEEIAPALSKPTSEVIRSQQVHSCFPACRVGFPCLRPALGSSLMESTIKIKSPIAAA